MRRQLKRAIRNAPLAPRLVARAQRSTLLQGNAAYGWLHRRWIDHRRKALLLPDMLDVEVTTRCNSHCVMCPHDRSRRTPDVMPLPVFEQVVRRAAEAPVSRMNLNHMGEPLLDPHLLERVRLGRAAGLWVQLNTNAAALSAELARGLLDAGPDHVAISFCGCTPATYEAVHRGLSFDRTLENIDRFLALRGSGHRTYVSVTFVRQPLNRHEVGAFRSMFRGRVDDLVVRDMRDWAGAIPINGGFTGRETSPHLPRSPCKLLWSRMVVLVDGRVALCEVDWDGRVVLGDLESRSIADLWTGEIIQQVRWAHLEGHLGDTPLCSACHVRESWW